METKVITISNDSTLIIKLVLDPFRKIIHVMDLGLGSVDIQAGASYIKEYLLNDSELGINSEWLWFLYKTNGSVNHYNNGNFNYVPVSDERVYPAFIGDMLIRRNKLSRIANFVREAT